MFPVHTTSLHHTVNRKRKRKRRKRERLKILRSTDLQKRGNIRGNKCFLWISLVDYYCKEVAICYVFAVYATNVIVIFVVLWYDFYLTFPFNGQFNIFLFTLHSILAYILRYLCSVMIDLSSYISY